MSELFEVPELVRVAVEDEKSGVAFYGALADKDWPAEFKQLFASLREQEKYHQRRFEDMLAAMGNYQPKEEYTGQYMDYLRALTDSRAFHDPQAAQALAVACKTPREAIDLATRFERDTLVLLKEMQPLVPERDYDVVDELTREEQAHLVVLQDARRMLKG